MPSRSGKKLPILVVGSIGLDTIETPAGTRRDILGGSASHFSLAARQFGAPVGLVGVVGRDFPARFRKLLAGTSVDLAGLEVADGETFRWHGRYEDFGTAVSLATHLNVFEHFRPRIPEAWRRGGIVFLANIAPALQLSVLEQVRAPRVTIMDTMNFWIGSRKAEVLSLIGRVDAALVNHQEARDLTGKDNLVEAARELVARGAGRVIVKKGEHGALMVSRSSVFACPAYPTSRVVDTTGAGDSFAGGVAGFLSSSPRLDEAAWRRAVVHGCIMGSLNVEGFGVERLASLARREVAQRYRAMVRMTAY